MRPRGAAWLLAGAGVLGAAPAALAQVYRCEGADGRVEYRASACEPAARGRMLSGAPAPAPRSPAGVASAGTSSTPVADRMARQQAACEDLARQMAATVAALRSANDRLRREQIIRGSNHIGIPALQKEQTDLRMQRTGLALGAVQARCEWAQQGKVADIAKGYRPSEVEENGLSEHDIQKCETLRRSLVAVRSKTGRYPGVGRPHLASWGGAEGELVRQEFELEDQATALRCPLK